MAGIGKSIKASKTTHLRRSWSESKQIDFELDLYSQILDSHPDYVDVLRVYGNLLSRKGRYLEGMTIDRRLIRLRPSDPIAHYNLACTLSMLKETDMAFIELRKALELGYSDFNYIKNDKDLDPLRRDPRMNKLLVEFQK